MSLTAKQEAANKLLASDARHILLYGGSRSGKTFLIVRAIVMRALKAPNSRHISLRYRFGHIKSSLVYDTFPAVMRKCFPGVEYTLSKTDWFVRFANGAEYWFGGLDDKERTEKILGNEYCTIHLNECSQIPWPSRNMAVTRLAQLVTEEMNDRRRPLALKMYYDENPPDKGHWTYKLFRAHQDPEKKSPLPDPEQYVAMQMNPGDNAANLPPDYVQNLQSLSGRMQTRFLLGEFREASPGALFIDETLDRWRAHDGIPQMQRIVVAVDPSGADDVDNIENDEIGIVVCGLGLDGNGYILEDLTCKAGPATWGRIATQAYERHQANAVVAEVNYGGAMVKHVIQSARPRTPFRDVRASRGKVVRAEPVASLMETGRVRLGPGDFRLLEEELYAFTTHGFTGADSPNRADAMIWGISDLFPALTTQEDKPAPQPPSLPYRPRNDNLGWMAS